MNALEPGAEHAQHTTSQIVSQIAAILGSDYYPNADRAALKRWALDLPLPLAYHRLWLLHMSSELPASKQISAWAALTWGLAYSGHTAHSLQMPLGKALALAGWSEARLERLLSASADLRLELFQVAQRFLAAKGQGCNFVDWADYLLVQEPSWRDNLNLRIASSYYRQLHLQKQAT